MPDEDRRPPAFWRRQHDGGAVPAGEHLARLRRGLGRPPGSVPELWPYYSALRPDGALTAALTAEHLTLGLYGLHQQSKTRSMHVHGTGLGDAVRQLKARQRYSAEALDRRFVAAASAGTVDALGVHLRGLVQQLSVGDVGLDYDRLVREVETWQRPEGPSRVRRRWGAQYFAPPRDTDSIPSGADDPRPSEGAA